jgi:hypothetical protein
LDAPDGAFGVVFLSEQGGREQEQEYGEPIELLHSDLLDSIGLKRREGSYADLVEFGEKEIHALCAAKEQIG